MSLEIQGHGIAHIATQGYGFQNALEKGGGVYGFFYRALGDYISQILIREANPCLGMFI